MYDGDVTRRRRRAVSQALSCARKGIPTGSELDCALSRSGALPRAGGRPSGGGWPGRLALASAERARSGVRHLERRVNRRHRESARALRRNPDLFPASSPGPCVHSQSWAEDALRELRRAAALDPKSAASRDPGRAWIETGNAPAALADANRVLAREPGHLGALALRGDALLAEHQTEEARAVFSSVVELHPAAPDGHRGLGGVHRVRGHVEAAVESYRTALARDGRDVTSVSLARL